VNSVPAVCHQHLRAHDGNGHCIVHKFYCARGDGAREDGTACHYLSHASKYWKLGEVQIANGKTIVRNDQSFVTLFKSDKLKLHDNNLLQNFTMSFFVQTYFL
jgi:hypothetical protein